MKKFIYPALLAAPSLAFAQTLGNLTTLSGNIRAFLNTLFPILLAVAVLYFFWGLVTFIRASGDPKNSESGKSIMIWGIASLFIMVSIWGILTWLGTTTGLTGGSVPSIPTV